MDAEYADVYVEYERELQLRLSPNCIDHLLRMPLPCTEQNEMMPFFRTALHGQTKSLSMLAVLKESYLRTRRI